MDDKSFQKLLAKVRGGSSRDELANSVQSGLQAILPRPEDRPLLSDLQGKAANITGVLPAAPSGEIRQAIVRCVLLLETAQKNAPGAPPKSKLPMIILAAVGGLTVLLYLILIVAR